MLIKQKLISFILLGAVVLSAASCVADAGVDENPVFTSYLDIPGITEAEIEAVEALRSSREYFSYGMESSTECFLRDDGSIGGFAALCADWLTALFDIPFKPVIVEWEELLEGLETFDIDFTGDLTPTQIRIFVYYMTSPIVARPVVKMWLPDRPPPKEANAENPIRYIFTEGAVAYGLASPFLDRYSEVIFVKNNMDAYKMLEDGAGDIFVEEAPYEAYFDRFGGVVAEGFFPLINSTVSITTRNPELKVIIDVIQKAIENGARRHLTELYHQGYQQYRQEKLSLLLTESEKAYIAAHTETGKAIPVGMEFDNYPTSFYNSRENKWQGIAFDVLGEIEKMTGLRFEVKNDNETKFTQLLEMLESGEVALVSEVIPTLERRDKVLFTNPYASDYYALISLTELEDAQLNDILYMKVGLQDAVAYTEVFWQWFPNHSNTVPLTDAIEALGALERGEIDMYMGTRKLLLQATNFLEKPGFKTNIVFNYSYDSTYGVNLNETELHSIINKAMQIVDTERINERWTTRVFNYQSAISRARTPYLIGLSILMLAVIGLLVIMFSRGRRQNVLLSTAVAERTRELEEQMKIAVAASESKSRFLATMSHEIRTPMNAIIGLTQIELQKKDIPNTDTFEKIYSSGINLLGIINDILDMSKIDSGKLELNLAQYDVPSLINDAVQLNIVRIGNKPIEFSLNIDETLPSKLFGDELRLKQILSNLLSNAVKYTDSGRIELSVSASQPQFTISGLHPGNDEQGITDGIHYEEEVYLTFTVSDTGHGMKPEDLNRLFTEYLRFYAEANRTTEGTGLGLNITKKLVEMMDGTISAESEYGKGSVFTVTVKQNAVSCEPIGEQIVKSLKSFTFNNDRKANENLIERYLMPYGSVLVVDDSASNLYVASGLLSPYKLSIDTVDSGFEAIKKVENGAVYDIIFMDHMMPQMDGIETTKKLRELKYDGVIVALTANALVGNDVMFTENGFDEFISKPIDIRRLDSILNKFIRDKHPEGKMGNTAIIEDEPPKPDIPPELIKIFCAEASAAADKLRKTHANGELKLFTTTVHAMKSVLAGIGEKELSSRAAQLEKAGNDNDIAYIGANYETFTNDLEELVGKLRIENEKLRIVNEDSSEREECSAELLQEKLEIIKAACEDYDDAAALEVLEELKEKQWDSKTSDALEDIYNAIYLDSDFEKAVELIEVT